MTLQIDTAVSALSGGARARGADPRVLGRLADVQSFLGHELAEVERCIETAVSDGPEPAVSAARHLVARGGKRVRPLALLLAARCFPFARGPQPAVRESGIREGLRAPESLTAALREMAAVVELVHSATLLHDDVVDDGAERRGAVTSRRLFGNGVSVLSGDLLLVNALERTQRAAPELVPEVISTLRRLVDGEIVQLRGRTELDVSEETYFRILEDKTASLFSLSTRAGATLAGASAPGQASLGRFGEQLGVAFQLVDDVIDYAGQATGKALFADLTEGKMTLPLVLAIELDPGLRELVARIHGGDPGPVSEVSRRVVASGSCDEVRRRARQATEDALTALSEIEQTPASRFLEVVARELTQRVA